ncbi:hypothetical protein [Devosia sp. 2618]|uniref:hypothetical protein n=1 Tax=Devosia sp. 2618 TaxID=3156454 RepID=UPI003397D073
MTYEDPSRRQPKGDHNRRISLGVDPDHFAAEAGITVDELHEYETSAPDHGFDVYVAERVGETLQRLEAVLPNSQTGRQHAVPGARVEDVGVIDDTTEDVVLVVTTFEVDEVDVPLTEIGEDGRVHAVSDYERADNRRAGEDELPPTAPFIRSNPD